MSALWIARALSLLALGVSIASLVAVERARRRLPDFERRVRDLERKP